MYDLSNLCWRDLAGTELRPAARHGLPVTISAAGGDWSDSAARGSTSAGQNGDDAAPARTDIVPAERHDQRRRARCITTGPSLTDGAVYFWDNQGIELPVSGIAVLAGNRRAPSGIDGRAGRLPSASAMDAWGSGKPGTPARGSVLDNFPARLGQLHRRRRRTGRARPRQGLRQLGLHRRRPADDGKRITIPATAVPGYAYNVWADHDGARCPSPTSFQVCTFKPSRAPSGERHGHGPLQRPRADQGTRGQLERHTQVRAPLQDDLIAARRKGQPPVNGGGTRAAGWTKDRKGRADGLRQVPQGLLPAAADQLVRRSGTRSDARYWGAWTSVAKVTVR